MKLLRQCLTVAVLLYASLLQADETTLSDLVQQCLSSTVKSTGGLTPGLNTPCAAGFMSCNTQATGRVSVDSCNASGTYGVGYGFNGTAGTRITFTGQSPEFIAYIGIGDGRPGYDDILATAQASFTGGTATINYTLPYTGLYLLLILPTRAATFGNYTVTLSCTTGTTPPPPPPTSCQSAPGEVCIGGDRFRTSVTYTDNGQSKMMTPIKYTANSALFWFNDSSNIEVIVKIVNGCSLNQRYWVYAGGTTDVEYNVRVVDTRSGVTKNYPKTGRAPFQTITDGNAFATCP